MTERSANGTKSRLALAAALALVLGTACGGGEPGTEGGPARLVAGDVFVVAALEPADGRVGENEIVLALADREGRAVTGAEVAVRVHMVAMGAMPAMGGPASVEELGDGRYRATFELDMGGQWLVEVEIEPASGAPGRLEGTLGVSAGGLRLRGEAGGATAEASAAAGDEHAGHGAAGENERHPAEFVFEPGRLQKIGVRTAPVERTSLVPSVRALGRVVWDETALLDIAPKVGGWIQELHADAIGSEIEQGGVLFTLYSPELYAAQEELLQASRSEGAIAGALVSAARNRLRLSGIAERDVEQLLARGRPLDALPIRSPSSGYLIEKNVVAGSAVSPGERLMRIAPLDRVWIEVEVYEADFAHVHLGQRARVTLAHGGDRAYEGTVSFVHPALSGPTRTGRARIELANPGRLLRPDMFVDVALEVPGREALLVPESAVLYAGKRRFVFVALGEGRFRPVEVEVGVRDGERVEVVSGLRGDEQVVSSGTFLIASESRLRAALEQW